MPRLDLQSSSLKKKFFKNKIISSKILTYIQKAYLKVLNMKQIKILNVCCCRQVTSVVSDSVTPKTAAHQAPPSLGFSRQEHWSVLPFPSPMHESEKWKGSCSVVSDSSRPHGLQPTRLLRPWDFPGKSTGVGNSFFSSYPYIAPPSSVSPLVTSLFSVSVSLLLFCFWYSFLLTSHIHMLY